MKETLFPDAEPTRQEENIPAPKEVWPEKIFVDQIEIGDSIKSLFVVTRLNLREFDRGKFLTLRLADKTGKISAILWDGAEDAFKQLKEGSLVVVNGKVNSYQNEPQITLKSIRAIEDTQDITSSDFLPESPRTLDEMIEEFDQMIESIEDQDFKALLTAFREDDSIWYKFSHAPGAKLWHHPYLHGLLEHTLSVVQLCRFIGQHYPAVNTDLLITGAVFHDSGKMDEFIYDFRIDYSTEGRLLGHIYIGTSLADRLMGNIPDFPIEKRRLLLHMILSHHGETERSPVLPMTLEANLLHFIENMDAQTIAFTREMDKVKEEDQAWTGFVNLIQRFLYRGETTPSEENDLENETIETE